LKFLTAIITILTRLFISEGKIKKETRKECTPMNMLSGGGVFFTGA